MAIVNYLRANFADLEEYSRNLSLSFRDTSMIVMSGIFGFIGFVTAENI